MQYNEARVLVLVYEVVVKVSVVVLQYRANLALLFSSSSWSSILDVSWSLSLLMVEEVGTNWS